MVERHLFLMAVELVAFIIIMTTGSYVLGARHSGTREGVKGGPKGATSDPTTNELVTPVQPATAAVLTHTTAATPCSSDERRRPPGRRKSAEAWRGRAACKQRRTYCDLTSLRSGQGCY